MRFYIFLSNNEYCSPNNDVIIMHHAHPKEKGEMVKADSIEKKFVRVFLRGWSLSIDIFPYTQSND